MSPLRVLKLGFIDKASDFSMILEDILLPNIEILRVEQSCRNLPEGLVSPHTPHTRRHLELFGCQYPENIGERTRPTIVRST